MVEASIQECLTAIDRLGSFAGSEEDATQIADGILQRITEIEHAARLKWLKSDKRDTLEYEHESDQIQLLNRKFRAAQLQGRANRRARWLEQRQAWSKPAASASASTGTTASTTASTTAGASASAADMDPSVGVSEQVSANLRRIHQLAQAEVLRSELNIEELQSSSNALVDVQHKYSGVEMLLNGSRRLVKLLDQADSRDRRQMQLALSFLGAVLIWIIYRRVLKLPIKLLMWTLARIMGIARLFVPKSDAASVGASSTGPLESLESLSTLALSTLSTLSSDPLSTDPLSSLSTDPLEAATGTAETALTAVETVLETLETVLETVTTALSSSSTSIHIDL